MSDDTTTGFFEPGKAYIQSKPYTAPELLAVFRCVAVAEHPVKRELRAFGFLAAVYPGDNWGSDVRTPTDWAEGWTEHADATTPGAMAMLRRDLNGPTR